MLLYLETFVAFAPELGRTVPELDLTVHSDNASARQKMLLAIASIKRFSTNPQE